MAGVEEGTEIPLLILYGSQTGNAQDTAERIAREAQRRHFRPTVLPAEAYLPHVTQLPDERAVVFVVSTTGQGDPPDNFRQLWKFLLRKSLPPGSLAGMPAAVFGLGDSGYPKYNVIAKKLYRRLEALGAPLLLPLGLGDDQHRSGHEAALDPWLRQLWAALRARFPLPPGLSEPPPEDTATELQPRYRVTWLPPGCAAPLPEAGTAGCASAHEEAIAAAAAFDAVEAACSGLAHPDAATSNRGAAAPATTAGGAEGENGGGSWGYGPSHPYFATLACNRRITAADHFQDVRHLEIDLGDSGISFEPGDVLAIMPQQPQAAVDALLQRCGLDLQAWVRLEPAGAAGASSLAAAAGGSGICSATVRVGALVAGALDVAGASPRRLLFEVLQRHASSEVEAERLRYFSTPEGRDDLHAYNRREGRTLLEVVSDFPSAALPLEWLLSAAPRLKPRLFSIASSQALHPRCAQLAVAIVDWVTPYKRRRRGVCTSWLSKLEPGARLPLWARRGALRLPRDPRLPLVMVGPGTGVAPFRAFLQQRQVQVQAGMRPPPAPCYLFFGCRNEHGDFYYRQEWEELQRVGVLAPEGGLVTAFSRDQARKVYVQQRIREQGALLWQLLQQGALVYVAGSADKMPSEVAAAVEDVVQQQGGMGREAAAKYVRQLELSGRWHVEAWS